MSNRPIRNIGTEILTVLLAPTTQFQCDSGASPTPGFSINSQGQIEYKGNTKFVACQTGENGGSNVYTSPNEADVSGCQPVTLTASGCSNQGAGGSTPGGGASSSAPGGGAGASPSASAPGGGASPSGPAGGSSPSGPGAGAGPSPSGPGAGGAGTSVVSIATPSPSGPAGGGAGTPPAGESSVPGGGVQQTTIRTTQTIVTCPESSGVPGGPGAGTQPTGAPSGPGGGAGPSPSGPGAGTQPSGTPSGPGAGTQPSGTPSGPGAGTQPSGTPSGPGAGTQPSGTPSGPGAGTQPSGTPSGPGAGSQPSSTGTPTSPGGGASSSCPTDLSGSYETPHLIVPIDSSSPSNAAGTSYNGTVSNTVSTIFNFDIPQSDSGKTCSLVFLFPELQDLETSSYSFNGDGKIDFAQLSDTASQDTSYSNAPGVKQDLGTMTVSPGNSYSVATFSCPAGQSVAYEMKNAGSTNLDFFEDWNPSP